MQVPVIFTYMLAEISMPNYRRAYQPGGCWFFTVNLADRRKRTLVERYDVLMSAIRTVKRQRPFRLDTLVVLPDHLHSIWELPEGDTDFPGRWRAIKSRFSAAMPVDEVRTPVQIARAERGIWQRRYWEHLIRDDDEHRSYVEYCYYNPVKHGYVSAVRDWPHSTYRRDVRAGLYAPDFDIRYDGKGIFGERDL
jgi:putative transposase